MNEWINEWMNEWKVYINPNFLICLMRLTWLFPTAIWVTQTEQKSLVLTLRVFTQLPRLAYIRTLNLNLGKLKSIKVYSPDKFLIILHFSVITIWSCQQVRFGHFFKSSQARLYLFWFSLLGRRTFRGDVGRLERHRPRQHCLRHGRINW